MHLLWPNPDGRPLDDQALAQLYTPDRSQPQLRVNFVTSVDGAVEVGGFSAGLGSAADQRVFGLLRMFPDALMVGAGTLRHERYDAVRLDEPRRAWRSSNGLNPYPRLVVVSAHLDLEPTNPALSDAPVRPVILTHESAPPLRRRTLSTVADVRAFGADKVDLSAGLAALRAEGMTDVLCEGGPHLLGALTAADLVDDMCLTISPMLAGAGAGRITGGLPSPRPRSLSLGHVLADEGVLLLRYVRAN